GFIDLTRAAIQSGAVAPSQYSRLPLDQRIQHTPTLVQRAGLVHKIDVQQQEMLVIVSVREQICQDFARLDRIALLDGQPGLERLQMGDLLEFRSTFGHRGERFLRAAQSQHGIDVVDAYGLIRWTQLERELQVIRRRRKIRVVKLREREFIVEDG